MLTCDEKLECNFHYVAMSNWSFTLCVIFFLNEVLMRWLSRLGGGFFFVSGHMTLFGHNTISDISTIMSFLFSFFNVIGDTKLSCNILGKKTSKKGSLTSITQIGNSYSNDWIFKKKRKIYHIRYISYNLYILKK